MTDSLPPFVAPEQTPEWAELLASADAWVARRITDAFAVDATRVDALSLPAGALWLDASKQAWDADVLARLLALAKAVRLPDGIEALFAGAEVNFTEHRPALHMVCRGGAAVPPPDRERFTATEAHLEALTSAFHQGELRGATGARLDHVVNLGIGGSDLGPRLVCEALSHLEPPRHGVRFVANLDPGDFNTTVRGLEAARTLFVVSSKSFGTAETLANLERARAWLARELGTHETAAHFLAITSNPDKARALGFAAERILWLPPWVGGRYSLWSAVGLPVALAFGWARFLELRAGARRMDQHFRTAPLERNLPVWLGLLGLWNASLLDVSSCAVLPYDQGLAWFPAWLQQLEMESNGKRCRRDGSLVPYPTAAVVWGMNGTLGQHAFHQLFYQGTRRLTLDFIVPLPRPLDAGRRALAQHALAQAGALLAGRTREEARAALRAQGLSPAEIEALAPHHEIPGNRPSSVLLTDGWNAGVLGELLAAYEHATFVRGWIWGIDPFDQYGVELGKELARTLAAGGTLAGFDPSTRALAARLDVHR